jgi:hypothetical protein
MDNQQLIIIKSVMKPRNYSTLRAILKEEQGEKITPYIFKMADVNHVCSYLEQERINFEIYEQKKSRENEEIIKAKNLRKRLKKAMIKY